MGVCGRVRSGLTSALPYYYANQAIDHINDIAELKDGWAGEGSLAPTVRTISAARFIAIKLFLELPISDIAAMPNGTIAFDWETEKGTANLELGDTDFSFYISMAASQDFYPLSGLLEQIPTESISYYISSLLMPNLRLANRTLPSTSTTSYYSGVERLAYARAVACLDELIAMFEAEDDL